MDRWRKAYTQWGFEDLDRRWDRFIVYGTAAALWVNLTAWLISRNGIIPGIDGPLEWLTLALLAIPGTARAAFMIALGPSRKDEWSEVWENPHPGSTQTLTAPSTADPAPVPAPGPPSAPLDAPTAEETKASRKWWKLRMRVRSEFTRRRRQRRAPGRTHPGTATWSRTQGAGQVVTPPPRPAQPPPRPMAPAQPRTRQGGSAAGTVVKILAVLTLFAVCGGYWVTGGNFVDPSDTTTEPPRLRNVAEKRHMLDLINDARTRAGVASVVMGTNNVAQIQADQLLEDCVSSHWGTDGLKPYQRYSLAGGYQVNGENFSGHGECGLADTLLSWNDDPMEMVADSVEGLLGSPGHRETMLSPEYRRVNIGLAWDRNVFKVVQHFEGDYVELDTIPAIEDGVLELEGTLTAGHAFTGQIPLMALIAYDPAPRQLSAGQLARTYCYGHGESTLAFIPPSRLLRDEFEFTQTYEEPECIDPYNVQRSAAEPESQVESARMFEDSRERSEQMQETELTLRFRKAGEMTASGREFSLRADMADLLDERGPGVYTVVLIAALEGMSSGEPDTVISEYSIFHEAQAPTGYGTSR